MRWKLLFGGSVLVLGGCSVFLGLDPPTFDGPLVIGEAGPAPIVEAGPTNPAGNLTDATRWSTYGKSGGGYVAGPFDGRFIYFLRSADVDGPDAGLTGARILRYDTTATAFDDDSAWTAFDADNSLATTGGHYTAMLDGKYLVIPARDDHRFLRFDTSRPPNDFGFSSSWEVFDATDLALTAQGFSAALPIDGGSFYGNVGPSPVEHHGDAFDAGWSSASFDAGVFGCGSLFAGICAGSQLFLGPSGDGTLSCFARFDPSAGTIASASAWSSTDLAPLGDENQFLIGMVATTDHVYLTQFQTHDASAPLKILRKPFTGDLDAGWESEPTNVKNPLTRGFVGGVFDGRYVYFAPFPVTTTDTIFSRYDTTLGFGDPNAWDVAAGAALGIPANRFWGAVFDGQYVYFPSQTPLNGETPTFARFKAYDTKIAVPPTCAP